ncbi:MAG: ABC transporter permease [Nocardioides sp.]|uniref:ABC transporter permease n=1 Tax=Nocardioides sp. TaxID=35761 RepID=UPI0039E723E0
MVAYIIRRSIIGVIMLLVMSFVTYIFFFASPVDPAQFACGKNCSPELREQARKSLGYDQPVVVQWGQFLKGVVVGRDFPVDEELREKNPDQVTHCSAPCFGFSVYKQETVNHEIKEAAPVSISLGIAAVLIWLIVGVLLGVIAAIFKGTLIDRGVVGLSLFLYAFPTFFIGTLLLTFVCIQWHLYPVPSYTSIAEGGVGQWAVNLLMPAITLAVFYMAGYVRMTRAFVLESMGEDYIRTARAKGLPKSKVLFKHGLRAALTPLVTMAGLDIAAVLGGAIITESLFNYDGLGKLAVDSSADFDLPTIIGLVLLLGAFVIIANIIVDVLYAVIDPRVRVA